MLTFQHKTQKSRYTFSRRHWATTVLRNNTNMEHTCSRVPNWR